MPDVNEPAMEDAPPPVDVLRIMAHMEVLTHLNDPHRTARWLAGLPPAEREVAGQFLQEAYRLDAARQQPRIQIKGAMVSNEEGVIGPTVTPAEAEEIGAKFAALFHGGQVVRVSLDTCHPHAHYFLLPHVCPGELPPSGPMSQEGPPSLHD